MKRIWMIVIFIVLVSLYCHAYADSTAEDVLKAVVKIRSVIPKEAPSASTLGTEREGNGVVIDAEGTILTIGYLIREAETINVIGPEAKPVSATLVAYDYDTGFGLLRTGKPLNVTPIKLGQSSAVKAGDQILVAGYGGEESAQGARVISRHEFAGYWEYLLEEAIYTVPAYTNFSGAALINPKGQLVGIGSLFTQVTIPGLGYLPCNVFVPIDLLSPILSDLKNKGRSGKAQRPWLGINVEEARGRIFITKVTSGGPAEKAGLKPGDMILTVDGKEVKGLSDLYRKIWALGNAGVQVPLSILQDVKVHDIKVRSVDREQHFRSKPPKDIAL